MYLLRYGVDDTDNSRETLKPKQAFLLHYASLYVYNKCDLYWFPVHPDKERYLRFLCAIIRSTLKPLFQDKLDLYINY